MFGIGEFVLLMRIESAFAELRIGCGEVNVEPHGARKFSTYVERSSLKIAVEMFISDEGDS